MTTLTKDSQFCDVTYNSAGYAGGSSLTYSWDTIYGACTGGACSSP